MATLGVKGLITIVSAVILRMWQYSEQWHFGLVTSNLPPGRCGRNCIALRRDASTYQLGPRAVALLARFHSSIVIHHWNLVMRRTRKIDENSGSKTPSSPSPALIHFVY